MIIKWSPISSLGRAEGGAWVKIGKEGKSEKSRRIRGVVMHRTVSRRKRPWDTNKHHPARVQLLIGTNSPFRWNKLQRAIWGGGNVKALQRLRANNKGIGGDRKIKSGLRHLSTLLLSIINANKTPGARVAVGRVSQARKTSLPANIAELVATWELASKEPSPGNSNKVISGYGDYWAADTSVSLTGRRLPLSISL